MKNKLSSLYELLLGLWRMCITYLPGSIGFYLRYKYWKKHLQFLGENVTIDIGVYFQNPEFISLDDGCWIDKGVIILAGEDKSNRSRRYIPNENFPLKKGMVHIGKKVHIGPYVIISGIGGVYISDDCGVSSGVKIYSFTNHYRSDERPFDQKICCVSLVEHSRQYMIEGPIFLGKNVTIALHAIIFPGVTIKSNSLVAINSVVLSNFNENSFISGNPGRLFSQRFIDKENAIMVCE